MNPIRKFSRPLLPLGLGLAGLLAILSVIQPTAGLAADRAAGPGNQALAVLSRGDEPIILEGSALPTFLGVDVDDLALFSFDGTVWTPIPYQIDEVNITGTIVPEEDGILDANDQVVFMAGDADMMTPSNAWWAFPSSTALYDRYALHIIDPINAGEQGWVYVYRGQNLPVSGASYVAWDANTQTVTGVNYASGLSQGQFVGLASVSLNGSADILDRQKFWVAGTLASTPFSFTEELSGTPGGTGLTNTIALATLGPVRATAGNSAVGAGFAFYGQRAHVSLALDLSDALVQLETGLFGERRFETVRTTVDFVSPTLSAMQPMTYYDANTATGVAVDGQPDAVATTPMPAWYQVSGAHGSIVSLIDVDPGNGLLSWIHRDDGGPDPDDTGDGFHYGEAGFVIQRPGTNHIGVVSAAQIFVFLDPALPNVGDSIALQAASPLMVTATPEGHPGLNRQFLPGVFK